MGQHAATYRQFAYALSSEQAMTRTEIWTEECECCGMLPECRPHTCQVGSQEALGSSLTALMLYSTEDGMESGQADIRAELSAFYMKPLKMLGGLFG